ncbi:MAG TPA: ATP-binding protein [Vicinamibacterales bacterium]|nr:ATP-binding protein [Vicinamibacterales bacterium]
MRAEFRPGLLAWRRAWLRSVAHVAIVVALLCLAAANMRVRWTWHEVEDGVLWSEIAGEIVAKEVSAGSPAAHAGVRSGDILEAIDGKPALSVGQITEALHRAEEGDRVTYAILREGVDSVVTVSLAPIPSGSLTHYYLLAIVGIFSLLVGAGVRLRRPESPATLHFFWLTVAFFGVMSLSFAGRLDTLDWVFYWGDIVAMLLLPPLFLHFALMFPERSDSWLRGDTGRTLLPLLYLPALLLGAARVSVILRGRGEGAVFSNVIALVEQGELLYLGISLVGGLALMVHALGRVRSVTSRRQLRWIVWGTALGAAPFVLAYGLPYALGFEPVPGSEWTALLLGVVPLAFASAIVRYRLMDVEVIIKRGLVYAAAVTAIVAIYAVLLEAAAAFSNRDQPNELIAFLATAVVVLLSRPVKNAIQTGLDRAYYRDRYDYRRALVGFARDLNSDLDLFRLSDRLVHRVTETLLVDRMALLLAPMSEGRTAEFATIAHAGFAAEPPALPRASDIGTRLASGHTLTLDDHLAARRVDARELEFWREFGIHYFVPCVSKEGTIAVMALGRKASHEPLSSEDMALLAAVAAQAATAIENGRLYRQLRVKAEELDRLREFSENILESLNDGLAVLNHDDRVVRWNRRLEELYGVRHEDAVERGVDEIFDETFLETLRATRRESPEGAAIYRVPLLTRHEPPRHLLVNIATTPLRDSDGAIAGTILVIEDISSRVQLEEQLQISEKMASLGLLAAGVAHEVNTPLTGISSYTQMLLQGAEPDDPKTRVLEKIERQTFRAAKIVNGLLNLARPAQVDSGPVDVNAVINDVLSLLEHQFRSGRIQVRKELAAVSPVVLGIEYKLQQVFLNLFLNARDAMPRGGWLTIVTRDGTEGAVVEVSDTGSGIPPDHLSRIYDPFFTTKDIGKGTGLGLSITYGIVQEHGGTITCDSTVGQGTKFTLTLPLAASRAAEATRAANRQG